MWAGSSQAKGEILDLLMTLHLLRSDPCISLLNTKWQKVEFVVLVHIAFVRLCSFSVHREVDLKRRCLDLLPQAQKDARYANQCKYIQESGRIYG